MSVGDGSFSTLTLLIGIPGAGKTTWLNEYVRTHPSVDVVSTDKIREELFGTIVCDPSQNDKVYEVARNKVDTLLRQKKRIGFGPEVIVDSTNVDAHLWKQYKDLKPSVMFARVFLTPPEEAIKRMQHRTYKVPADVIERKWSELQNNLKYLNCIFNMVITMNTPNYYPLLLANQK